jgi:hypothetical protein
MKTLATIFSAGLVAFLVLVLGRPEPGRALPIERGPVPGTVAAASVVAPRVAASVAAVRPAFAAAATEAPASPAAAPARPEPSVDDVIAAEVEKIAVPLGLDAATKGAIEALTRQSFAELMAEIEARAKNPDEAKESTDAILARRTAELHARILDALSPALRPRYREIVGLR